MGANMEGKKQKDILAFAAFMVGAKSFGGQISIS